MFHERAARTEAISLPSGSHTPFDKNWVTVFAFG